MHIQPALDKIAQCTTQIYETGKAFVLWGGHKIQAGISLYVIPAAQKLYELAVSSLYALGRMIKNGPGAILVIATALFATGIAAFKMADREAYEDNLLAQTAWKTLGVTAFISATAFTSLGIAAIFAPAI